MEFTTNLYPTYDEIEKAVSLIQRLDPPGIGARNLKECLSIQIGRKKINQTRSDVLIILNNYFEELSEKKHEDISHKMNINSQRLREALKEIARLNPKPGEGRNRSDALSVGYISPDFKISKQDGQLHVWLNWGRLPTLTLSSSYLIAKENDSKKDDLGYLTKCLDDARDLIDGLNQFKSNLISVMQTTTVIQKSFFDSGDILDLKPLTQKQVAQILKIDASNISRMVSSRHVETDFGTFPLSYFFPRAVKSSTIKNATEHHLVDALLEIIKNEPKVKPLSDPKISNLLAERGFVISKKSVSNYRDKLKIPAAAQRKRK